MERGDRTGESNQMGGLGGGRGGGSHGKTGSFLILRDSLNAHFLREESPDFSD